MEKSARGHWAEREQITALVDQLRVLVVGCADLLCQFLHGHFGIAAHLHANFKLRVTGSDDLGAV